MRRGSTAAPTAVLVVVCVAVVVALALGEERSGGADPLRNAWDDRCLDLDLAAPAGEPAAVFGRPCEGAGPGWEVVTVSPGPSGRAEVVVGRDGTDACLAATPAGPDRAGGTHEIVAEPCETTEALQRWRIETADGATRIRLTNVGVDGLAAPAVLDLAPGGGPRLRPEADELNQWWFRGRPLP